MDVVEFASDQERAAAALLRQVVQNHATTHGLSFNAVLNAAITVLRDCCVGVVRDMYGGSLRMDSDRVLIDGPAALIAHKTRWLKRHLRTRHAQPSFPPGVLQVLEPDPSPTAETMALAQALRTLVNDACEGYSVERGGASRMLLSLVADVLAVLMHEYDQDLEEVDALIDSTLHDALLRSVIEVLTRPADEA